MTYQLYRHFDSDDRLLYVGISLHSMKRLAQHSARAPWINQIARVDIQQCRDKAHALRAEKWAIWTEAPLFNVRNRLGFASNVEVGKAIRFTLKEAYDLAAKGEVFTVIDPVEFECMGRQEKRMHRRAWKRLARKAT